MKSTLKLFLAVILAAGATAIFSAASKFEAHDIVSYVTYMALAIAGACMKVRLPNIRGTFSLNFFFILIALAGLPYPEAMTIACASAVVQCYWRAAERPQIVQVLFNVAAMALSVAAAHYASELSLPSNTFAAAILAATVYFLANTALVSTVLAISTGRKLYEVWQHWFLWSFPYYAVGAGIAAALSGSGQRTVVATILPAMYLIYRYYRLYVQSRTRAAPTNVI